MPSVSGSLKYVTLRAAAVSEVLVRAPEVRTGAGGVITSSADRVPVANGEVSFTVSPGPAVLTLVEAGRPVETIPILVGSGASQSLQQVVSAAKVADDATQREIEKLAAQAVELIDASTENARKAQDGATRAETAAGNAKKSETAAASSASEAGGSAASAASSASKADTSERNAKKSVDNAYMYAMAARDNATRAANIADSTSWDGDKLTVNGKTSPSLRGPKGDRGDTGQPGPKGDSGASTWGDITDKPATFPPQRHTHDASEITGTTNDAGSPQFGGKVLTPRRHDGKIFYYSSPTEGKELANKAYVDREVGSLAARAPRGKPVEVVPAGRSILEARNWLRRKLVEYGTTYDTAVVLPFDLDTSQITSMSNMFSGCSSLTEVPPMNTSNVTNMGGMFDDCSSLVSVPPMNTSNVTNMNDMFSGCSSLTEVPPMNTSNVTSMNDMFSGCSSLIPAEVRLYRNDGTKPANTYSMISGTQLTREPFYTPDGTPIN